MYDDVNAAQHMEVLAEVGALVAAEYAVERALEKMNSEWRAVEMPLEEHKPSGTPVISDADSIFAMLDEQLVKTHAMRGSPYILPFEERLATHTKTLIRIHEIFDEWRTCQRTWLYLWPIFRADDIQRQIPTEAKRFESVTEMWTKTMEQAASIKLVLRVCASGLLLERLKECNRHLGRALQGLETYLNVKRKTFARFYFLSNDELVSVLADTADRCAGVQPHLPKCFEGISRLVFEAVLEPAEGQGLSPGRRRSGRGSSSGLSPSPPRRKSSRKSSQDGRSPTVGSRKKSTDLSPTEPPRHVITGMISPEGELVPFITAVTPDESTSRGHAEVWLHDVEYAMKHALNASLQGALKVYLEAVGESVASLNAARHARSETDDSHRKHPTQHGGVLQHREASPHGGSRTTSHTGSGHPSRSPTPAIPRGPSSSEELAFTQMAPEARAEWTVGLPAQVALTATQVLWTAQVESALCARSPQRALLALGEVLNEQLTGLVHRVRGSLAHKERIAIGAILTTDVHQRDVVSHLQKGQTLSMGDFQWLAQLRYYWEAHKEPLSNKRGGKGPSAAARDAAEMHRAQARMLATALPLDLEYLGASTRLVVTPLTDRCYRTLISAVHMVLGGAAEGPAGTGKSETTKDLAKAFSKACLVFNCSEGMDFRSMGKLLKGLAQTGAWSCFDEFNRIEVEVLSVIAQQVQTIHGAVSLGHGSFTFEGEEMPICKGVAIFITMNPQYEGRAELPDNLKALFRPCAMSMASYDLIAEISLYASGFLHPRLCAGRMVRCLTLAAEQLSQQEHYDFGMRTVKACLKSCGELKSCEPEATEVGLTYRAIVECNVPKMVNADLLIFEGIAKDLFPDGVDTADDQPADGDHSFTRKQPITTAHEQAVGDAIEEEERPSPMKRASTFVASPARSPGGRPGMSGAPVLGRKSTTGHLQGIHEGGRRQSRGVARDSFFETPKHPALREAIEDECSQVTMQATPKFLLKCVQLYETLTVRHAVMLVGEAMVGKTSIRTQLNAAIAVLAGRADTAAAEAAAAAEADLLRGPALDGLLGDDDDDEDEEEEEPVHDYAQYGRPANERVLYPKALSLNELYGHFDPTSHEWSDGVLAVAFRQAVAGAGASSQQPLQVERDTAADAEIDAGTGGGGSGEENEDGSSSESESDSEESVSSDADDVDAAGASPTTLAGSSPNAARGGSSTVAPSSDALPASGPNALNREWVVFDGPVGTEWVESLNTVLDDNKKLCLTSGETVRMTSRMAVVFETAHLSAASPATVSRVGIIYCEPEMLGWRPLAAGWLGALPPVLEAEGNTLRRLFECLVPPCLAAIKEGGCKQVVACSTSVLVLSLCRLLLSLVLDPTAPYAANGTCPAKCVAPLFLHATIWSLGGTLDVASRPIFETALRQACEPLKRSGSVVAGVAGGVRRESRRSNEAPSGAQLPPSLLDKLQLPTSGSVWDFAYDRERGWVPWLDDASAATVQESAAHAMLSAPGGALLQTVLVPTAASIRMEWMLHVLLAADVPALFCGPSATGKSAIITRCLERLDPATYHTVRVLLTGSATAAQTRSLIEAKLERKAKGVLAPPEGTRLVLFVDDVAMAAAEPSGAQPPVELLRQALAEEGWHDPIELDFKSVRQLSHLAAMVPPSAHARHGVSARFLRRYHLVQMPHTPDAALSAIFKSLLTAVLAPFEDHVKALIPALTASSIDLYRRMQSELLPTPERAHYAFTMRDLRRLIEGMRMVAPSKVKKAPHLARLWYHECTRVFGDRLVDDADRAWLAIQLKEFVSGPLGQKFDAIVPPNRPLAYVNFMLGHGAKKGERTYEEVVEYMALAPTVEHYLTMQEEGDAAASTAKSASHPSSPAFSRRGSTETEARVTMSLDERMAHDDEKAHDGAPRAGAISAPVGTVGGGGVSVNPSRPLSLVMFSSAVTHLVRITRIIAQPAGSALLIGVSGSGRRSLTRLAAYIEGLEHHTTSFSSAKEYSLGEWHEDLHRLVLRAGRDGVPLVFLVSDTRVRDPALLEDVQRLLDGAEVPHLMNSEEMEAVLATLRTDAPAAGRDPNLSMRAWFVERCMSNLRFVFSFSPLGGQLRGHLRVCPALATCTTIDWCVH